MGKKLFLYCAQEMPHIYLIVYRKDREAWQLIHWNSKTNTFIEGQWLLGRQLAVYHSCLSPCGGYFYYLTNIYNCSRNDRDDVDCMAVSNVPNFTALLFTKKCVGRYDLPVGFSKHNRLPISYIPFEQKGKRKLKYTLKETCVGTNECFPVGPILRQHHTDYRGRNIVVEGPTLWRNGKLIYDASENEFEPKSPITI